MMTQRELIAQVMQGVLLIVGDYRGSRAELAGFVDSKTGMAIRYMKATHLIECAFRGVLDRVIVTEKLPETIETVEQAEATFTYVKGRKYVFYIDSLRWERGQVTARKTAWEPEEIEEAEGAPGPP